jgi:actin-related protein
VDFGSHTTRAGYAGEDCPRVVCPSFFGYTNEASSSTNTNGAANGDGDVEMDGIEQKKRSGRKLYVGDNGVNIWRPDMEVGNFMTDGVGRSIIHI